ncbi:MAG: signal peptide peptidase SppA [Planctomycetia bacterium]|nr:signal peptide peptidase SppA [Planctomycetia bacterium]
MQMSVSFAFSRDETVAASVVSGRRLPMAVAVAVAVLVPIIARSEPPVAEKRADTTAEKPAAVSSDRPAAKRKNAPTIAHIALTGAIPDGVGQGGLLADVSPHLHRIVERLDKAAKDARVKAVLLSIESPALGRGRAEELRAAIARVRRAGKPVAAHLIGGEPVHYLVASACDTIAMPPAATLEITGVRAEVTFFKAMLDKLGVDAEILQVGEFKGAGEPLTRTSMSPQLRAQYESFVGDLYEQLVERIAADRRLPEERVRELVDAGIFTPESAREAKLIDAVAYEDEVASGLAGRVRVDEPRIARDYAARKMDADFSGIGGLVKLVEMLSGQRQEAAPGKNRQIAIIHLTGEIKEGKGTDDLVGGGAAGADSVIEAIRDAAKDDKVAAIVLRIDSPGGSALASDLIWREAERTVKPVVASLSDTAASGGYYVAVAADRIVAAPGTLTGSIGVVGGKIAVGGALERVGVHTDVVSKGRNAGWLSMQSPFTADERAAFLATMKDVYRLFTSKVAAGRRLDMEKVATLAEGRVFTGRMAKEAGLVDRLGTLEDAIDEARRLAGIEEDQEIERVLLPEPRGLFDDLFGNAAGVGNPVARLLVAGLPGLEAFLPQADALLLFASGRPLLLMPARVRVR